ncbi:MAG: UDP-glucose/GDP-mannose dehydrogenase family protein [Acidimicrobiaceae bacterium]|nr:UDP-glucose/GDP-mannose dehydrogenase family protein [Acidimicrobiaceae bacterium]
MADRDAPTVPADGGGRSAAPEKGGGRPAASAAVAVVGAGYVGLTTAACLARLGHRVTCTDVDESRITALQRAEMPIHEPGLAELVRTGIDGSRLSFACGSADAAARADFVFLCVPTPSGPDGGTDLGCLEAAAAEIGPSLRPGTVVVNKSTAPAGTVALLARVLGRADVSVASNPEFLRQGSAVHDFLNPDRLVVGAADVAVAERVAGLYAGIDAPVLVTDPASAETVKYAANAFLATKLSFSNSVAALCEAVGADADDVLEGMGHDRRIGRDYLRPGPGWGGSCLPKDTRSLVVAASAAGYDFALLRSVVEANEAQFARIVDKVARRVELSGARVALLGLAFKAGTDDLRDSPALEIARRLAGAGAAVHAYDPMIGACAATEQAGVAVADDAYAACDGASALVVATEWDEFRRLDLDRLASLMDELHVIDARNLLDRGELERRGFTYSGVGV